MIPQNYKTKPVDKIEERAGEYQLAIDDDSSPHESSSEERCKDTYVALGGVARKGAALDEGDGSSRKTGCSRNAASC